MVRAAPPPGAPELVVPKNLTPAELAEWHALVAEVQAAGRILTAADGSELHTLASGRARLRDRKLPTATFAALSTALGRQLQAFIAPPPPPAQPKPPKPESDWRLRPLPYPVPPGHPSELPWAFDRAHPRYHEPCDGGACCGRTSSASRR